MDPYKNTNLVCWLAPFIKSFPKDIKIAFKENTLIFFSFSAPQFPGQTACKTCCWSEQRAPGKFSAFVSKYRKINQQPKAPRKAKYLQTQGWRACSTSTGLHCPVSVLQEAAFLCSICKHPWAMWAHSSIRWKSLSNTQFIHCVAKESIHPACPRAGTLKALLEGLILFPLKPLQIPLPGLGAELDLCGAFIYF